MGHSDSASKLIDSCVKRPQQRRDLSEWMAANALVCWHGTPAPWEGETALIGQLDLPLNLDQNAAGSFHSLLHQARAEARQRARSLPVLPA
jgi:hypothetical protein